MNRYYLPALRGLFGDWVFYSCLMPMGRVVNLIRYAEEVHESKKLSDMIQRALQRGRSKDIAEYLKREEQRFFNSLVVATYGGKPAWHGFEDFRPNANDINMDEISNQVEDSVGFLSFSGEEKMFALDGQHRLAGMREAIKGSSKLSEDEVSLIFVAHSETMEGRIRTRKLFTTLNKTARPVGKGERIALDESDVMAIVTRHLVENHPFFHENRIKFVQNDNLPKDNIEELTTIGNIYEVLTTLFTKVKEKRKPYELKFIRPNDEELEEYIQFTDKFFRKLASSFPALREYFESNNDNDVIAKYRTADGGHVLFRPVGLRIFAEVLGHLVSIQHYSLDEAFELIKNLPIQLDQEPYRGVIWFTDSKRMNPAKRVLVRQLLLYMLRANKLPKDLKERYAQQLGLTVNDCNLPTPIV